MMHKNPKKSRDDWPPNINKNSYWNKMLIYMYIYIYIYIHKMLHTTFFFINIEKSHYFPTLKTYCGE